MLVNQSGGGTGVTSQSGYANTIELNQSALINGAYTAIDQSGEFNDAKVYQEVGGRYPGGNVILSQDGTGNMADVAAIGGWANIEFSQTGVDNELTSYQSGRANNVKGYSNGDFNQVDIMQDGDGSTLDIAQNGSENVISATQNGSAIYGDTASIAQTGTANVATLTQGAYGEGFGGHTASISQNGLGNSATVTQR